MAPPTGGCATFLTRHPWPRCTFHNRQCTSFGQPLVNRHLGFSVSRWQAQAKAGHGSCTPAAIYCRWFRGVVAAERTTSCHTRVLSNQNQDLQERNNMSVMVGQCGLGGATRKNREDYGEDYEDYENSYALPHMSPSAACHDVNALSHQAAGVASNRIPCCTHVRRKVSWLATAGPLFVYCVPG